MKSDAKEQLEIKRHTLAHLLAKAVIDEYPNAKLTLGPAIDNGFYYDIDFEDEKLGEDELKKLQKSMKKLLSKWETVTGIEVSYDEAREYFRNNPYKLELINEIEEKDEPVTLYYSGPTEGVPTKDSLLSGEELAKGGFVDLCRGGHLESPAQSINADAFNLDRVAGAYWRGDEKNTMLTRIYGLAFDTKEELDAFFERRKEAEARDHRKIGKELDLFTFSDLVGPGLPLYTPKGQIVKDAVTGLLERISKKHGYQKVAIPHLAKLDLYKTSGHAAKFEDEFFYVHGQQSGDDFVLKPMNCPHHTQIYASTPKSYRDLPIRMAEITAMYRDEKPGELLGLSRTRAINVDDAHVFCRTDQISEEATKIVKIIEEFYTAFGLWNKDETFWVSLSVRDPQNPEKYLGDNENWNKAEQYLQEVSDELELDAIRKEGEAAFYGPKLDFMFTDALGRETQLATIQIDFVMPERFGLEYTDSDGEKKTPVMIHRAIAGSFERFLVILIEHFAGHFPVWLSPVQVAILPVNEEAHGDYANEVHEKLRQHNIRVEYLSDGSLGKRIRSAKTQKIPYQLVLGDNEQYNTTVTAEGRNDEKYENISIEDFIEKVKGE